jgi:1,4-dihydroxy-2-naphthoate octaprenyltransferase
MSTTQNKGKTENAVRNLAQFIFFGVFIAGMIFALPTMLVLTLGLLPTLVAFIVDAHPRKYAARSVGFLNFAGTLPFLVTLWSKNQNLIEAMRILTDVYAWLVIYTAAAAGWIIYLGMPSVAGFLMELTAARRIRKLDAERRRLIQEWGDGVNRAGSLPS